MPPAPSLGPAEKTLSLSLLTPTKYLRAVVRSPQSLLFPRPNRPSSRPLLLCQILQAFNCLNGSCYLSLYSISLSLLYWDAQHWCQYSRCASPVLRRGQYSVALTVHLSSLYFICLSMRMSWRHLSKVTWFRAPVCELGWSRSGETHSSGGALVER